MAGDRGKVPFFIQQISDMRSNWYWRLQNQSGNLANRSHTRDSDQSIQAHARTVMQEMIQNMFNVFRRLRNQQRYVGCGKSARWEFGQILENMEKKEPRGEKSVDHQGIDR